MSTSLKEKASSALFWNFIDKGGQQIIQLVFLLVLARLLSPDEFGLIGVLSIFTIIANILQESGFFSALVRKKDVDESDYSSVFYFNVAVSFSIYGILFFAAPFIASFFGRPELTTLSRVLFITFILNSFAVIQNVHLHRKMDFQTNTKITFVAGLVAGAVSVVMACNGFGVWSLVVQQILLAFIRNVLLGFFVRWYPTTRFVFARIKSMFSYSVNILLNSLLNQISNKLYNVVIGKYFSMTDVGFYEQASKLNNISQSVVGSSLQGVIFPVLTRTNSLEHSKRVFRKALKTASFISFPLAMITIVAAAPIVAILLGEKWMSIVPILQILAVGGAFYPPLSLIASLLQAEGKSKLLLRIEVAKNILLIAALFFSFPFGVLGLVAGWSLVNVIAFVFSFYFAGKCISYNLKELFKDVIPYISISILVFAPMYLFHQLSMHHVLLLILQIGIGGFIYLLVLKMMGSKVLDDCLVFIRKMLKNHR